ncbi:hypothetical protein Tco_0025962, partial [Tanacetum coccineum]
MAQSSNEVTLDSSYFSDNASSFDDDRSPSSKVGSGFEKNSVTTSGAKQISFVASVGVLAGDGSTIKVCLRIGLEPDEWIKDSGCSKDITGNKSLFSTYKACDG